MIGRQIIYVKNAVRIAYHVIDQTIAQIAKKVLRNMPTDVEKFVEKTTRKDATTPVLKNVVFATMKLELVLNVLRYSFLKKMENVNVQMDATLI